MHAEGREVVGSDHVLLSTHLRPVVASWTSDARMTAMGDGGLWVPRTVTASAKGPASG
jgi:hypothetical protein